MANRRTGRGTVLFGLLVVLAGLAGAVVLYLLSQQRDDDAIRDLARAPVGCQTTMVFYDTGTYYVYVEHLGTLDALEGTCSDAPEEYSRDADDAPVVEITVRDGGNPPLEFDRPDPITYSLDDSFAGTAKWQVEIESTGEYVVDVVSADDDFVVAVGRDPAHAGDTARLGAIASGIAGILLGFVLVLMGIRRGRRLRRIETAYTARPEWPVGAPVPTAPPVMQPPVVVQRLPAPQQPGGWTPVQPVGPPVADHTAGPFAPPSVFAPPAMPNLPPAPPREQSAPRDAGADAAADGDRAGGDVRGDVRGDASR